MKIQPFHPGSFKQWSEWGSSYLRDHGIEMPERTARDLFLFVLKKSHAQMLADPEQTIPKPRALHYQHLVLQRGRHVPLQYLLGTEFFQNMALRVGPGVLIPRPETELLVDAARAIFPEKGFSGPIADLGTGSGNIALALSQVYPGASVWAVDKSATALKWALKNKRKFPEAKVRFLLGDAEKPIPRKWRGQFHLVVSNPPYIPSRDMRTLQPEVRQEPKLALDGGRDGLQLIRRMASGASRLLQPQGVFICEIGIKQWPAVKRLLRKMGFGQIQAVKDWQGIARVVIARLEK